LPVGVSMSGGRFLERLLSLVLEETGGGGGGSDDDGRGEGFVSSLMQPTNSAQRPLWLSLPFLVAVLPLCPGPSRLEATMRIVVQV
jgi:hypothetical protein